MSKVSCEAAGKHRRCDFANGAAELALRARLNWRCRRGFANGAAELLCPYKGLKPKEHNKLTEESMI